MGTPVLEGNAGGVGASRRRTGTIAIFAGIMLVVLAMATGCASLGMGSQAASQSQAPAQVAGATPQAAPATPAAAPKAYVGLFKDNAVAVIDTGTNKLLTKIPIPTGPHGLAATPDGQRVYASSDGDSRVSIIDTSSDKVVGTIEVGKSPHGLAMTPDGEYLLVAVFDANQVAFVDTKTNQVIGQVAVANPHNIAISPDGRTAYVAAQGKGATALAIIDIEGQKQTGTIPLDKTPRAIGFSPDGKLVYFTQAGLNAVQVLDPSTNKLMGQIPVGASPHHPLFTPDGKTALVVDQGPNEISMIDPATNNVAGTVQVGVFPHWIAVTGDSRTAYVTDENSNEVSVVDIAGRKVTATIPVGNGPRKLVIASPAGPKATSGAGMAMSGGATAMPAQPAQQTGTDQAALPTTAGKVTIVNFAFGPTTASISTGQTVTWTNADSIPHTVTADDGSWDSGQLQPGASYRRTFDQPGTLAYHCSIHPFMHGTVEVKG